MSGSKIQGLRKWELARNKKLDVVSSPIYRWPVHCVLTCKDKSDQNARVFAIRFWGCLSIANNFRQRNPMRGYTWDCYLNLEFAPVRFFEVDVEWWRYEDIVVHRYRYRYRSCDPSDICYHVTVYILALTLSSSHFEITLCWCFEIIFAHKYHAISCVCLSMECVRYVCRSRLLRHNFFFFVYWNWSCN
jgi:hypothetical protein